MSKKYSGVEIDAVFYDTASAGKKFDISHDEQVKVILVSNPTMYDR